MYYYSKRSRSKIVHQSTCQHIQNVSVEDVGSFENLEDAYAAGYRDHPKFCVNLRCGVE